MAKKVGILGGMGPLATVDLFQKIVENTPAQIDQDHLRIMIDNHPQIPNRVEAALRGGPSPLPAMTESLHVLEAAGVDFIVIPCNTAHYWLKDLQAIAKVPVFNMIQNAASVIRDQHRDLSGRILLLATEATVQLNLYQSEFAKVNMEIQVPTVAEQKVVDAALQQVKAGFVANNPHLAEMNQLVGRYIAQGTAGVIGGCTEIPLLFPFLEGSLHKFDATMLLAKMVVDLAKE